ncbi:MAG: J domain-containing protein [Alphaproteobacteria bacterium]|nr:J domain-containing protein [Alphaproteobacteria bacterium]
MKRRLDHVAVAPDPFASSDRRCCEWAGCAADGDYRAPQSRDRLDQYRWFCLEHVRQYNAGWDYYRGMSQADIEADLRRDTVWQRPTWPLGGGRRGAARWRVHDGFGFFDADEEIDDKPGKPPVEPAHARAFAIFGLEPPVTQERLRARYLTLVKLHHPDANGGDKAAEERLKSINEAYATLKNGYFA